MTKGDIVFLYSSLIIGILIIFTIILYFKDKTIKSLMLKIKELDDIYFDEIKALEEELEKINKDDTENEK